MKITIREAEKLGIAEKIYELTGINKWAVHEGQLHPEEVLDVEVPKDIVKNCEEVK